MTNFRTLSVCFLLVVMAFMVTVQPAAATTMNFTVNGGEEETRSIDLAIDDRVVISFTVVGQSDNTLYFSMVCPNGIVWDFGKTGSFRQSFVCDSEGKYELHFSNTDSSVDKLVTLNYEVQHYIFGMPQMLFWVIIIVVVSLAAVAVFVMMGKPH